MGALSGWTSRLKRRCICGVSVKPVIAMSCMQPPGRYAAIQTARLLNSLHGKQIESLAEAEVWRAAISGFDALPGDVQPVQGDLAHFLLAESDVGVQHLPSLLGAALKNGIENLPVL